MQLFYAPDIATHAVLDPENSHHCVKVLRKSVGDTIELVDGKGFFYEAAITDANARKCAVGITKSWPEPPRDRYVHIAIAPTKNMNRTEWFVEKAVEIGVDELSFVATFHSERKHLSAERIGKIAVSAMKQSLKATLPKINELQKLNEFVARTYDGQKFVAHLAVDSKPLHVHTVYPSMLVLIGPEGDFDEKEIQLLVSQGYTPVSMGNARLRTETAGVVACTLLNNL